jgi:Fe-S-cluster containining protein
MKPSRREAAPHRNLRRLPPGSRNVRVDLAILGRPYRLELAAPPGPVRPIRMLPVLQTLTDEIVRRAERAVVEQGKTVSCRAGCGACCRQIVPIGETEARHLAALVDAAPPARRDALRARFAAAREALQARGLWERLHALDTMTAEAIEQIGLDVFHAGVPCPFLEDESCSIHRDRPLSCREFLVTSPAEHCRDPSPDTIEPVPIPSHPSDALARLDTSAAPRNVSWMPLVFALEWAAAHPDTEVAQRPALEHLERFLGLLVALGGDGDGEPEGAPPAVPAEAASPPPRGELCDRREEHERG